MGSPVSEPRRFIWEGPQHEVVLRSALAVGRYTVTFAEWDACKAAGGCTQRPADQGWGRKRRPVINVSWEDAHEYARWLSGKTGRTYRLLTEAEWEYAARANTTTAHWWGPTIGIGNANCLECGSPWDGKRTAPVGRFRPNPFGLYDMLGNVWQWIEDCYVDNYAMASSDASTVVTTGDCGTRVVRGGSSVTDPWDLRVALRVGNWPGIRTDHLGFRLARTAGG
jgi:formylglycine-generating enzyme required for sulfatase activity